MPINTDLNIAPYFDDYNAENQFHRVLFKPGYSVQARELTQLQSILQNQIETFGDNIFKEGSVVKGCTFTNLSGLQYVKLIDQGGFDPEAYKPGQITESIGGVDRVVDVVYTIEGQDTGLTAEIISADRGFETRAPDLNTFYIGYLGQGGTGRFNPGEVLQITRTKYLDDAVYSTEANITSINATQQTNHVGQSFGIRSEPGVVFQKGAFLFADSQTLIISKYNNEPDGVSVGYKVTETNVTALADNSLYDNANGSTNENAPGADRLKLSPVLTTLPTATADADSDFFTLARYVSGEAVTLRDVSQYNVLGEEFARRTYEESGNYITDQFTVTTDRRGNDLKALIGPGKAYVKGFRMENLGEVDITIEEIANTAAVVYEDQPISLSYGNYVNITSLDGTVPIAHGAVDLKKSGGVKVGDAFVTNITPEKIYLSGVSMTGADTMDSVITIADGSNGTISVAAGSNLQEVHKSPLIFTNGQNSTKEYQGVSIPLRVKYDNQTAAANVIQLVATASFDFNCQNDDIVVVDSTDSLISVTSTNLTLNSSTLDINLGSTPTGNCTVYVNRRSLNSSPWTKNMVEVWVKVVHNSSTTSYSLGFPDVFSISSILDGSGTEFKNSFRLNPNQKDHHYDISYMELIPGRPVPGNGDLWIQLKTFQLTDTGDMYFTYGSYPIDDDSPFASNSIKSTDIKVYQAANGKRYNLRDCIDFRPYVDKDAAASYTATTQGSAPTISTAADGYTTAFTNHGSEYLSPAVNAFTSVETLTVYPSRIDAVTIDSYGKIKIVKGNAKEFPVPPKVGNNEMVIAEINIPGRPALTQNEAGQQYKPESAITLRQKGIKNYTMKDISKIDRKVESLEYYVTLNQIEQDVQNLNILDSSGLTRFKNGYLVDGFKDLSIANLENPNFNAAVAFDREILTPSVRTFPIDLKYTTAINSTLFPSNNFAEIATLSRNAHVSIINQPYATNSRNCVSNFYKYAGAGVLSPSHDAVHDTVADPIPNVIDNVAEMFGGFVENLQSFFPITGANIPAATSFQLTDPNDTVNSSQEVGDFVMSPQFLPFMRSKEVKIFMAGLRPNTRHYFFFDKIDVNSDVAPGNAADSAREVLQTGAYGAAVSTDANGVLRAVFKIPEQTFFVGSKNLEISDATQYSDIDSAGTSYGVIAYHAYNIALTQRASTDTTRMAEIESTLAQSARNLANRMQAFIAQQAAAAAAEALRNRRRTDPLAQTFFIKAGMGNGSNSVFASKVDVYFKRKSATNGINIMLREVINGYPSAEILPFSKVHLTPSQINVSADASVATTIDFEAPVRLDIEKEYALVLQPDANDPNYIVFISKVGGTDLTPGAGQGQPIVQDWGDGVLFTSTNNRAWKSYQDEDLKFNLYRHDFNASSGEITLKAPDPEFFTLSAWNGTFTNGDIVYQEKVTKTGVGITIDTTTLTGTSLDTVFNDGDWIAIDNGGAKYIVQIVSVDSATSLTIDRPSPITVSSGTATGIVKGEVDYTNSKEPNRLHLKNSTASSTQSFGAGAISGLNSGATGTIQSVDNINLSYFQALINKTDDSVTTTQMTGTFTDPVNSLNTYSEPLKFGESNFFNRKGVSLFSKSNDTGNTKPFNIKVSMTNDSNATSSPIVDIENASLIAYQYNVTNTPATTSKYISKTVELAADIDAEDMEVYVTGYRPSGTDIKVYIRPQNQFDSAQFDSIDWVELELFEGVGLFSSSANLNDFREFKYRIPSTSKNGDILEYTSSAGTFLGYRKFAIRIDLLSPNSSSVPLVKDYRGVALT
jgi:hypothetical protein